jgi:uncharacterized membrane protein (DUF485 family)
MTTQLPDAKSHGGAPGNSEAVDFRAVQESVEFGALRRAHRGFAFPVVVLALAWYGVYILLAAYAHDLMSIRVTGNITLGIVLGLSQIVTTFAIALLYVAYSTRVVDPPAARMRAELQARLDDAQHEGAPA